MPPWLPSGTTWIQSSISFLDKIGLKVSLTFISTQSTVPTQISGMIFQTGLPKLNSEFRKRLLAEIQSSLAGKCIVCQMG
jgi:hypothetical protein